MSIAHIFGSLAKLMERQSKKAQAEGQLKRLKGEGAPLPGRLGEAQVNPAIAVGHPIMAQAGVLPEEFYIKKELDAARKDYAALTDPAAHKSTMAKIADLESPHGAGCTTRLYALTI